MTSAVPLPRNDAPVPRENFSATLTMRSGKVIEFGRNLHVVQATPNGVMLSIIARDEQHGRSREDTFVTMMSMVEYFEVRPAQLQGLVS